MCVCVCACASVQYRRERKHHFLSPKLEEKLLETNLYFFTPHTVPSSPSSPSLLSHLSFVDLPLSISPFFPLSLSPFLSFCLCPCPCPSFCHTDTHRHTHTHNMTRIFTHIRPNNKWQTCHVMCVCVCNRPSTLPHNVAHIRPNNKAMFKAIYSAFHHQDLQTGWAYIS